MSPDIVFSPPAMGNWQRPRNRWNFRRLYWRWLIAKLLEVFRMYSLCLLIPVPPAVVALWFYQAAQIAPAVESSVLLKIIETSIVGAALFGSMWLIYKLQMQQIILLREVTEALRQDVARGGEVLQALTEFSKTKACIYSREQFREIAAEIIRQEREHQAGQRN